MNVQARCHSGLIRGKAPKTGVSQKTCHRQTDFAACGELAGLLMHPAQGPSDISALQNPGNIFIHGLNCSKVKKNCLTLILVALLTHLSIAQPDSLSGYVVSDFENLFLGSETFWNGADGSGGFVSGLVRLYNDYNPDWGTWSGWAYSSITDNETPGWGNQYSAITGGGRQTIDSDKKAIYMPNQFHVFVPATDLVGATASRIQADSVAEPGGTYAVAYNPRSLTFASSMAHIVRGFYITNSTYAALSMKHGDDFSKKFGGPSGDDPDWFRLSVWGVYHGRATDTIDFYLADFRFEDNEKDYIVESWEWLELSTLGPVDSLMLSLSSSDMGAWGMNTPAYFCIDDIFVEPVSDEPMYISEVLGYTPAPGQFINKPPLGDPESALSIIGGVEGAVSLGAFGGSMVFRFEQPVINHPDHPFGVDFILFGNPFHNFSEPGIVSVMKDENGNGLPDDTWYELAGSDYFFSSTKRNHEVTYFNPGGSIAADVPWTDNLGNTGHVFANTFHEQPYYPDNDLFPHIPAEQLTLSGTLISGHLTGSDGTGLVQSHPRAFGYADNFLRGTGPWHIPGNPYNRENDNAGGDGFDIGWAVDSAGNYVDLDMIHFVKVHTAMLADAGALGEVSAEIRGGVVTRPDSTATGPLDMVVIKDLPPLISSREFPVEALAFHRGRVQHDRQIVITTDLEGSHVDKNGMLHLTRSGELTLTACLADQPGICDAVTTLVDIQDTTNLTDLREMDLQVYPNPASNAIRLTGISNATVILYNIAGEQLRRWDACDAHQSLDLGGVLPGIYFIRVAHTQYHRSLKLIVK